MTSFNSGSEEIQDRFCPDAGNIPIRYQSVGEIAQSLPQNGENERNIARSYFLTVAARATAMTKMRQTVSSFAMPYFSSMLTVSKYR